MSNNVELFIATNGNDTNPGTKEKPFGSLERASSDDIHGCPPLKWREGGRWNHIWSTGMSLQTFKMRFMR